MKKQHFICVLALAAGLLLSGCAEMKQICVVAAYRHQGSGLVPVKATLTYEPIGIAVPRGDPQLINWLENFLHSIEKAGYMKNLGERWFAKPTWVDQLK